MVLNVVWFWIFYGFECCMVLNVLWFWMLYGFVHHLNCCIVLNAFYCHKFPRFFKTSITLLTNKSQNPPSFPPLHVYLHEMNRKRKENPTNGRDKESKSISDWNFFLSLWPIMGWKIRFPFPPPQVRRKTRTTFLFPNFFVEFNREEIDIKNHDFISGVLFPLSSHRLRRKNVACFCFLRRFAPEQKQITISQKKRYLLLI